MKATDAVFACLLKHKDCNDPDNDLFHLLVTLHLQTYGNAISVAHAEVICTYKSLLKSNVKS